MPAASTALTPHICSTLRAAMGGGPTGEDAGGVLLRLQSKLPLLPPTPGVKKESSSPPRLKCMGRPPMWNRIPLERADTQYHSDRQRAIGKRGLSLFEFG